MLDKAMLIGALKNDQAALQDALNQSTNIGKIMGKSEIVGQFLTTLENGTFDFVVKEESQEVAEKNMDDLIVKSENTAEGLLQEIQNKVDLIKEELVYDEL